MSTVTLDKALDTVMQLPPDQQEMLLDIVRSRHIERRRQEIAEYAQQSLAAFRAGQLKPQTASEVIAELRREMDDDAEE
jgi:hypothetical protein